MANPMFPDVGNQDDLKQVRITLGEISQLLNWLLQGNIDSLNIRRIDAKIIIAASITADKLSVTELSAISANLGTITAGSITTDAEINVGTDATIGNILNMGATDYTGPKKIVFSADTGIKAEIEVISGDIEVRSAGFVTFTIGSSMGLVVNKQVQAPTFHATSGMDVGGVPVALASAVSGTWYAAPTSGGSPTVALTFANGILQSAV